MRPLPRSFSIRRHLTLLVLAVLLPLIALNTYFVYRQAQQNQREAHQDLQRLAHLAAADAEKLVASARTTLTTIASQGVLRLKPNTPACDALFADIAAANPNFTHEGLVRLSDGHIACSSDTGATRPRSYFGPTAWLKNLARTHGMQISPAYRDARTGHWWIDFAYTLPSTNDGESNALIWSVDLADTPALHYRGRLARELLPIGSTDTLASSDGRILARWPYDDWVGARAPTAEIMHEVLTAERTEGTTVARGVDGRKRIYGFSTVAGTDWHVYIGIPADAAAIPNQLYVWRNLVLSIVVTLGVAGLAAYVGRRIARPIEELSNAASAATGGRMDTRVTPTGLAEIRQMAERFNNLLSARQRAESALAEEKRRAEITLHSIGDAVVRIDRESRLTYLNPAAEHLTGWKLDEAMGRPLNDVVVLMREQARAYIGEALTRALERGITSNIERDMTLVSRDGSRYEVADSLAPLVDPDHGVIGAVLAFHDITETRELERRLSWQARHDSLTGLVNRIELEYRLVEAIDDARQNGRHHALLYIDLDQFKVVNDTAGHAAGDELLRRLAEMLKTISGPEHTVARVGGDEFCVLLRATPVAAAATIADKIRRAIQDFRFAWNGNTFGIGASIGLVAVDSIAGNLEEIMNAADVACYAAKERGRNRVHVFVPEDEAVQERLAEPEWVRRISRAFDEERFCLYAQAIVPIGTDSRDPIFHELLVRLADDRGQLLPPTSFLPAAHRYNMLTALDRWVVHHAFMSLKNHKTKLLCSINLSGHSISDDRFLDFVMNEFGETGVPAEQICFEITESAAVVNLNRATHFMSQLRAKGARFALDDFGIGISSLAYLRSLPVDIIKIDGRFVRNVDRDHIDHAMVEAIIRIGRVMHLKTVAEFVENERTRTYVQALGVDYAQGYGVSEPRPIEHVLEEADSVAYGQA